ncbi:MAG TPA: MerR family transcriptional regulator [Ktedonobacteraceae bacterium]|nr:MerR family transcriptional regulator [Ktedonobacteraceae bacterium]
MGQHFYTSGEFAQKASVSVRTLRFYDKVGLLTPSQYTEAGYRLYTDADFFRLQQILALKFLGFSLEEIKCCLQVGPTALQASLALQKAMMQEKREQLNAIIAAIDETEKLLRTHKDDWEPIIHVIQVMQMTQSNEWRNKYFTDEQLQKMQELSEKSYTPEQRQKLAEWGKNWSEEDQRVASQKWSTTLAELQRLLATGADPASPEAQDFIGRWLALIGEFTHGDPGITEGLKKYYGTLKEMPANEAPFAYPYSKEGEAFLEKAIKLHNERQG